MEYDSRRRIVARPHMSMSERAKIFIPFDALKGFREELERRERKVMASDAPELMEERCDEISRELASLSRGDEVVVAHFSDGYSRRTLGSFSSLDQARGEVLIAGESIALSSIVDLSVLGRDCEDA